MGALLSAPVLLAICWIIGALACWGLLHPFVALTRTSWSALLVVALLWPVILALAAIVGLIGVFDWWFDRRLDQTFGKGDSE